MSDYLLTVRNLSVTYPGDDGDVRAVRNVSFTLGRERLGIVGESGSGKSTTGRAIMGLVGSAASPNAAFASCAGSASPWCCRTRNIRSIQ